jgi:glycosyltransferase involved in cell wall biosynthesis
MKSKIVYFTKYTDAGPSSRYRSYQYKEWLENNGFEVIIKPLFPTQYILDLYGKGKKNWFILMPRYIKRFFQLLFLEKYDILFIEYELFPYAPLFLEKLTLFGKKNIVIDYDDATFHTYDKLGNKLVNHLLGNKIYELVKKADLLITGSPYLTSTLLNYNNNVVEIPTSIRFKKYEENSREPNISEEFVIGWLGSKNTSVNVLPLREVFIELQKKHTIKLQLVGFNPKLLYLLEGVNYEYIQWNKDTEVQTISNFSVGIMPLLNNHFNLGKCGFKLIQYMACGVPTISTPLPANIKINRDNKNLFATTNEEWINAFEQMISNKTYFKKEVGSKNKQIVEEYYSVEKNYAVYIGAFKKLLLHNSKN